MMAVFAGEGCQRRLVQMMSTSAMIRIMVTIPEPGPASNLVEISAESGNQGSVVTVLTESSIGRLPNAPEKRKRFGATNA
jgi:hypothetical protein